jgi:hypothetical protein
MPSPRNSIDSTSLLILDATKVVTVLLLAGTVVYFGAAYLFSTTF